MFIFFLLLVLIHFQFQSHCHSTGWGRVGRLFEFDWGQEGVGGAGGRLFEAGRLLTIPAVRMGTYLKWSLICGWALIRINKVSKRCFSAILSKTPRLILDFKNLLG